MSIHGQLIKCDSNKEDWQLYIERMKQYFAVNEIMAATKKRGILLTACGRSTY